MTAWLGWVVAWLAGWSNGYGPLNELIPRMSLVRLLRHLLNWNDENIDLALKEALIFVFKLNANDFCQSKYFFYTIYILIKLKKNEFSLRATQEQKNAAARNIYCE